MSPYRARKYLSSLGEWLTFIGAVGFFVDGILCLMAFGVGFDSAANSLGRFAMLSLAWAITGVVTQKVAKDLL